MELLSIYLPMLMLLVFSILSLRLWKAEYNVEKLLMVSIGWAGIAVISITGSIILFVVGKNSESISLLALAPIAAYVAIKFKNLKCTQSH
ncbi:hypothetical protein [Glaciecola sp. 1036]|uniref:hypothetical protein n=1 Tax=Alteromonadaceae TaxID=72275 RepID=UPI003D028BD8